MLIYILDPYTFDRIAVVEEYESLIWTERYIEAGDFTFIAAEKGFNSDLLVPGVLLENEDSTVPMLIESIEIQDKLLTITGKTVETFFNQRSLSKRSKTASPGHVLSAFVDDMQTQFNATCTISGLRSGSIFAAGADVTAKITEREKVYELLLRLAQQYNIDMYVRRVFNENLQSYEFVFNTRKGLNRTDSNTYGEYASDATYATVRFSPEDDNLIGVHEVYSVLDDADAVVVYVPQKFTGVGNFGENLPPVIASRYANGLYSEYATLADLAPFETRIYEPDTEKLTEKYLRSQIPRYHSGYNPMPKWNNISFAMKRFMLQQEMIRMAEAEYKKRKAIPKNVLDGEVAANSFRFGVDYDLGDLVEITISSLSARPGFTREVVVTEYIRTADASGIRAYPTFSDPAKFAPYDEDPKQADNSDSRPRDHTFSINGLIPADLDILAPHKVRVVHGQMKQIVAISQTGPRYGTCTLYFLHNNNYFDETDLPITLEDGDTISIDPYEHNATAAYVSGHFTIEVS